MPRDQTTRRNFLQTGAAATAAASVPYFFSSSQAHAEDKNSRINVAAIGVGGRGTHIGHQAGELGNMVAVADVDRNHAENFAKRYEGKCAVFDDYRQILERKDVDAITCGTPDHWHVRIAVDAMRAGKDVYCEKPLTLTLAESQLITRVTEASGRVLQVGTQQRSEYQKMFLKAVAIARSGRLGDKLHALSSVGKATSGGPFETHAMPPQSLNFDFWLGQAPAVPFCANRIGWNFRWWLEYSGGQVTDWGVHHTDIALWALGGEETGIVKAEGSGDFPGLPADVDVVEFLNGRAKIPNSYNVAESFDCHLTLSSGNTINLTSKQNELVISGERGRIRVNRGSLTGKPVEEIESNPVDRDRLEQEVAKLYRDMPISPKLPHMFNFFDCVKSRKKPIADVWTHCNSVNACHIANISMLVKRPLSFDLAAYSFDDEQANRFIARQQRSPWGFS